MAVARGQGVLQLRVCLEEVRPVIWRRLLVPGSVRLPRLHDMLQLALGWTDSHLHQFRIDGVLWGMHFDDWPDEAPVTVSEARRDATVLL